MGVLTRWAPLLLIGTAACAAPQADDAADQSAAESEASSGYDPSKDLDTSLGEALWPNEQADIAATRDIITTFIKRRYSEGRTDTGSLLVDAAFRLGTKAVKFATIPVACGQERAFPTDLAGQQSYIAGVRKKNTDLVPIPSLERDDLRNAMQKQLENDGEDACFTFVLQRFVDQDKTPTEHSTVNWDLVAPMIPVADLRIPAQTFTSEAQDTFFDDMAFTPWHALPVHKPLGVVNRTRFVVYTATAKLRRDGNHPPTGSALTGPTGDETFD